MCERFCSFERANVNGKTYRTFNEAPLPFFPKYMKKHIQWQLKNPLVKPTKVNGPNQASETFKQICNRFMDRQLGSVEHFGADRFR